MTKFRRISFALVIAISVGSSLLFGVPAHHIAIKQIANTPDPLVATAADATTADCTATYEINVSPRYPGLPPAQRHVTTFACPAGTVMKEVTMSRSQATARHMNYVELPTASASAATKQEVKAQVEQLLAESATALLRTAKIPSVSTSTCGWTSTAS